MAHQMLDLYLTETESYKKVRLVDAEHTSRGTAQVNDDGKVFDIGRAKTRGIEHNSGSCYRCFHVIGFCNIQHI